MAGPQQTGFPKGEDVDDGRATLSPGAQMCGRRGNDRDFQVTGRSKSFFQMQNY